MGEDKALATVAGRPMIDWVVDALAPACDGLVVAGREAGWHGHDAVPDQAAEHKGPLAGLSAVARLHPDRALLAVAVDQPWLRSETVRHLAGLASEGAAVVPVEEGLRQTLCATYPAGLASLAEEELDASGSIQSLLDRISFVPVIESEWIGWGEDGRSWFSADTHSALEIGLARFGLPGS